MGYRLDVTSLDLVRSEDIFNTVKIRIETNIDEYHRDPSGLQTLTRSYQSSSPPRDIKFNLRGTDRRRVYGILHHQRGLSHGLSEDLTSLISTFIMESGLGVDNSFDMKLFVTLTNERVSDLNFDFSALPVSIGGEEDVVGRLVRDGAIDKSLDLELGDCSICFENLLGASDKSPTTRMSCSHVFHGRCISQWLRRKNSCPLCRKVLYGR